MYDNLLLDAKNTIYRAVYACKKNEDITTFVIFKSIQTYLNQFNPQNIHIFWDSRVTWRSQTFTEYKAHRDYTDVKTTIDKQVIVCRELFDNLGVYQHFVNLQEADDLIYAFCDLHRDKKNVIISSDTDLKQIMHKFDHVTLYNPLTKKKLLKKTR